MKFGSERDRIDERFYRAIQIKPQPLGGSHGVPIPVFERLRSADRVFINDDGLVYARKETQT